MDRQCKVCEMESQVTKEDIVIGKNGSHISVQCPGCNMPATLSYDFLGKILGTDKDGAKEWVRAQHASGRPNPVAKSKKGSAPQTFPDQNAPSPDNDPVLSDYSNALVNEKITYGEPRMNGDSCPLPNTGIPINNQISNTTPNAGFETIDVDRILEETPMDVLKNSYRGFRLPADVIRDLDKYFDLHFPQGLISPTEAQAGFAQFPKIAKSLQPSIAMEYNRNLNTWEIERKRASALYEGINLRNTKPNVNPFYGPVGTTYPGGPVPGGMYTPQYNTPQYTPEQQNVLMQANSDPNFQYRVQADTHLQQVWGQIQQIQQMQQQQNAMLQQQQMMYQRPQQVSGGMNEESLLRILRQERERTRMEMQQMVAQTVPATKETGTSEILLTLITEMMKNNGNQSQSAQQQLHQQQLDHLKSEIMSLKTPPPAKERDPLMDTIMSKMVEQSLGRGPDQMNAILSEIEELKKNRNPSSNGIRSSDDFHNFIELQKVMAEISDKKSLIEEKKENRDMIKNLVTEGIGQVAGVVGAIITAKSGAPPAASPGRSPELQQEVGAMVTEHTVTIPCMYCKKTITFPRGVESVQCPFCNNVMGVPAELSYPSEDSSSSEDESSDGYEEETKTNDGELDVGVSRNTPEVAPEVTPEVAPQVATQVVVPTKKTSRKKATVNNVVEAPLL